MPRKRPQTIVPLPAAREKPLRTPSEPRSFLRLDITERQLECLFWAAQGKSATDIGEILGISGRTVEDHLSKICDHFGVRTRVQAVACACELGLITRPAP